VEQTAATIQHLVDEQLASIADAEMREALLRFLIAPECQHRNWDYGHNGERYPCWLVARLPATDTAIAYCEHGFGPDFPWGIVALSGEWMGPDGAWHVSLERAFRNTREGARSHAR